jgi:hypothetical protein
VLDRVRQDALEMGRGDAQGMRGAKGVSSPLDGHETAVRACKGLGQQLTLRKGNRFVLGSVYEQGWRCQTPASRTNVQPFAVLLDVVSLVIGIPTPCYGAGRTL